MAAPHVSSKWELPPLAKPGRKPSQNSKNASQKAFRERKQEYVLELEQKVKKYELEDGEKAQLYRVQALQLREENVQLRSLVAKLLKDLEDARRCNVETSPTGSIVSSTESSTEEVETEENPIAKRARLMPSEDLDLPSVDESGQRISCGHCSSPADCLCNDPYIALRPTTAALSVPISRRTRQRSLPHKPVWSVKLANSEYELARAEKFTRALESSVCRNSPCASCPYRNSCQQDENFAAPKELSLTDIEETIECADAWKQLSEHPKIDSANLTMLADVVSKHTQCQGRTLATSDKASCRRLAIGKEGLIEAMELLDRAGV